MYLKNFEKAKEILLANLDNFSFNIREATKIILFAAKEKLGAHLSIEDLLKEEWRDIYGFESFYKISNKGQVMYIRKVYIAYDKKFGAKALAEKFNVIQSTILNVVHKRTFKNIL